MKGNQLPLPFDSPAPLPPAAELEPPGPREPCPIASAPIAGGEKAKARDILAALRTLKAVEQEQRPATPQERRVLAAFPGFGPVALSIFPHAVTGRFKEGWQALGEELRTLLTPEEYDSAKRTTFNAFYTSSTVIRAMYQALARLGVPSNALVLEPGCGPGRFLYLAPEGMRFVGVELDSLSGRIARALHPGQDIRIENFRDSRLPELDAVIGNVPFADVKLEHRGQKFSLHDFFFAKSIDALKPGGILALVTSHFTLDKQNAAIREYLGERADFLGAVRLPSDAFKREGTSVVTDIVCLRKRAGGEPAQHVDPDWLHVAATSDYGTPRANGTWLLELALNMKTPVIYDPDPDDSDKRVVNHEATLAAREKQKLLKERFRSWVFSDPDRTERLVRISNDLYNNLRPRLFDGTHLDFPGMSQTFELRQHRKDAVWRIMSGGNTLLAHHVGGGKSAVQAAAAMKMKEAGLVRKVMCVCPNHLLEQYAREFQSVYPNAKLLVAGKEDFTKERRKLLTAKIASGDWDAIVVTHSSFDRIGMSKEFQEQFLREQIAEYDRLLREHAASRGSNRNLIKTIEKQKAAREEKLKDLLAQDKKDDGSVFRTGARKKCGRACLSPNTTEGGLAMRGQTSALNTRHGTANPCWRTPAAEKEGSNCA